MTPPFAVGAIVWACPRPPQARQQGYHITGCYPAVLRRIEPMGGRAGEWWCYLAPCGSMTEGQTVMLGTLYGEVAAAPCAECAALWMAAGWQQLREAS